MTGIGFPHFAALILFHFFPKIFPTPICYRPGEGNVFTGVCLLTGGSWEGDLHGGGLPWEGDLHGGGGLHGGTDSPPYGKPAVGTHPTGMHSCYDVCLRCIILE